MGHVFCNYRLATNIYIYICHLSFYWQMSVTQFSSQLCQLSCRNVGMNTDLTSLGSIKIQLHQCGDIFYASIQFLAYHFDDRTTILTTLLNAASISGIKRWTISFCTNHYLQCFGMYNINEARCVHVCDVCCRGFFKRYTNIAYTACAVYPLRSSGVA